MDFEEPRRARGRGRGRGRPRGRPRGPQRGLRVSKRNKIESDEEEEEEIITTCHPVIEKEQSPPSKTQFDHDCDISALEAPTFTTLDRGPPAPMLQLSWDHPVNLIGEKVLSPRIHACDTCNKPILLYGRMIPCKHVFCLSCAKRDDRVCSRCGERVARVEQTGLGTVFMCTFKINDADCKRTYLSARDLQAHIDHRHKKTGGPPKEEIKEERINHRDPRGGDSRADPRVNKEVYEHRNVYPPPQPFPRAVPFPGNQPGNTQQQSNISGTHHIPVMTSARTTNLITVPLQDPPDHPPYSNPDHPPFNNPPIPHSGAPPLMPPSNPQNPPQPTRPPGPPTHLIAHMTMPGHPFSSPPPFSNNPPQYTYPPTTLPPPQPPTGVPPPIYGTGVPPTNIPTTYGTRPPQYDNQYPPNQWSTPPPQGPPARPPPPPPPHHHQPTGPPTSYYR